MRKVMRARREVESAMRPAVAEKASAVAAVKAAPKPAGPPPASPA